MARTVNLGGSSSLVFSKEIISMVHMQNTYGTVKEAPFIQYLKAQFHKKNYKNYTSSASGLVIPFPPVTLLPTYTCPLPPLPNLRTPKTCCSHKL